LQSHSCINARFAHSIQGLLLGLCTAVKCVQVCPQGVEDTAAALSSSSAKDLPPNQKHSTLRRTASVPCSTLSDYSDRGIQKQNRLRLGSDTRSSLPESVSRILLPLLYCSLGHVQLCVRDAAVQVSFSVSDFRPLLTPRRYSLLYCPVPPRAMASLCS
jgi:hypothetical protein